MTALHLVSIAEAGRALRAGDTTAVALTTLMLERIAAHDIYMDFVSQFRNQHLGIPVQPKTRSIRQLDIVLLSAFRHMLNGDLVKVFRMFVGQLLKRIGDLLIR